MLDLGDFEVIRDAKNLSCMRPVREQLGRGIDVVTPLRPHRRSNC